MNFNFYKYQGTGNDFVILDNRQLTFPKNDTNFIKNICDRRFGIGADGLMLLEDQEGYDFKMVYYNSDGNESSMCGNGGRCLVAFAKKLNIIEKEANFIAVDGPHYAKISHDNVVSLQMIDVKEIKATPDYLFLNTGSPHHIQMVTNIDTFDVKNTGAQIRYSDLYGQVGSNINFVEQVNENEFRLRTYERGGRRRNFILRYGGATAAALALHYNKLATENMVDLLVQGGRLRVTFDVAKNGYKNVFLIGPATYVFEGIIEKK
ncbi:diaminopimelate epimerase [Flavobacterium agricola]|uniref:diaminopimelate epimerase n=1 Tax=Flavobacterium agricola TaxID=2870839 RepID=UPI002223AAA3|nr:diaminopimelate epimerase [Flavobacterium agricola]